MRSIRLVGHRRLAPATSQAYQVPFSAFLIVAGLPPEHQRKTNLVICSNITFHRTPATTPAALTVFSAHESLNPEFPVDRAILDALADATKLFQNVPHEFPGGATLG
jgi:hypothetical protein